MASIGRRLKLQAALSAGLVLLVGAVAVAGLRHAAGVAREMVHLHGKASELSGRARNDALMLRRFEKDVFLNVADGDRRRSYEAKWKKARSDLGGRLEALRRLDLPEQDEAVVERMQRNLVTYDVAMKHVFRDVDAGKITQPADGNRAITPYKDSIRSLDDDGDTLLHEARERLAAAEASLSTVTTLLVVVLAIVAAILAGVGLFVARVVGLSILSPLRDTVSVLEAVASGDLSGHVRVEREDEVGRMAKALNKAVTQMREDREEIQRLAGTDELTGLLNRRAFTRTLEQEIGRSRRYGRPMAFLLLDVDFFKKINDGHGHAAGDDVLRHMGAMLRDSLRIADRAGRWGGEEFVVVLPETGDAMARMVAERLRKAAAALMIAAPDGGSVAITVSIGVTVLTTDDNLHSLVDRADRGMYLAKSGGRNQVVLVGSDGTPIAEGEAEPESADAQATGVDDRRRHLDS